MKQIYIETIFWLCGLLCLIIPVTLWLLALKKNKNRLSVISKKTAGFVVPYRDGILQIKEEELYKFMNMNMYIPELKLRVYISTYIWSLNMLVIGLSVDINMFYILMEVGFTNMSFLFLLTCIKEFIYNMNIVTLAKRMPFVMIIPPVYEGIELLNIPGAMPKDILYGVGLLIVLLYVYKIYIYIIIHIIIYLDEWFD